MFPATRAGGGGTVHAALRSRGLRWRRLTVAALGAALVTAACSSATDEAAPSSTNPFVPPPTTEAVVTTTTTLPPLTGYQGLVFSDQTQAAGVDYRYRTPFSIENYTSAMDTAKMRGGAAVIDYDRDGHQDLFMVGGGLEPDRLLRNRGDGTFEDVTAAAEVAGEPHLGSSVAVGDYDGDGWLDLFVTSHGPADDPQPGFHRLWHNDGDGTFTDVADDAGVRFTSRETHDGFGAAFADYDLDGDLDLFVAGWQRDSLGNRLFRNEGDGTFTDVTVDAGVVDDGIRGFSPCLVDTDGDRYPELMLVADFGTSRYFINNTDGTFTERTEDSSAGKEWSGMGTAVGDYDNDGMLDWYATAIFDDSAEGRGDGNKLYRNLGNHDFAEVAAAAGVADGGWGWGAATIDLDLDGWLDIVEVNGWHFEGFEVYTDEMAKVFMSRGDGTFTEVAAETGLHHNMMGLGLVDFDYDADGDRDIAITAANDAFTLYRNDQATGNHWLRVFLDPEGAPGIPPDGIGSRVWVEAGGKRLLRYMGGCANYLGTPELSAAYGLGDATTVDRVTVEWPNGTTTVLENVQPDQTLTITP